MSPIRNRFVPSALALIVGLAIGAVAAFALRGGFTVVSQEDPCYGHGELISTGSWTLTEEMAEMAGDPAFTAGEEREVRFCAKDSFENFIIDGPTGMVLDHYINIEEAAAYYQEHPEELPALKMQEALEKAYQENFVPADVPTDLTAGCDPSWVTTTFEQVQAAMCHPPNWTIAYDDPHEGGVGTDRVEVALLGIQTESHNTKCDTPTLVDVPSGTARVCALPLSGHDPGLIMHYGIALPNGRNLAVNIHEEATPEEEALALRVAANVESLP